MNTLHRTLLALFLLLATANIANAATLSLSPSTGVYGVGSTFIVRVVVNTQSASINATEGTVKFNPNELSVVSIDRSSSIFNLWVTEPTFSNSAGTVTFSGGAPSGYTGGAGTVFTMTFRSKTAQASRVTISDGAVLANDGKGSNVLTSMGGGTYTIQAASTSPEPEVIEYVAPANTPAAPVITSSSHSDPSLWYKETSAILNWTLPAGVVTVRTLLDSSPNTIPTKVYDTPIRSITLEDLEQGTSYFHIQFRNEEGWGKVTHYRLAIDSIAPSEFAIAQAADANPANPSQTLQFSNATETSGIARYMVRIDNQDAYEYLDPESDKKITLPPLRPGYHTVTVEAFDRAGNSSVANYSFTIQAFERPRFTNFPTEINEEVIPVLRGETRPNSTVVTTIKKSGAEASIYTSAADDTGVFTVVPAGTFTGGVYEVTAVATDPFGATSEVSEPNWIAVQKPGYLQVGSLLVNVLSVLVSLIALVAALLFGATYLFARYRRYRTAVKLEAHEVVAIISEEFSSMRSFIKAQETELAESRKTKKLTKIEINLLTSLQEKITAAEQKIRKEAVDVEEVSK